MSRLADLEACLRAIVDDARDEERTDMRDSVDEELIERARMLLERDDDEKPILSTGARVTSVDEEGDVTLYAFQMGRTLSIRVPAAEAKKWAARIGDGVTVEVINRRFVIGQ